MKINPNAGYERYQSYVQSVKSNEATQAKGESRAAAAAENTDKVTLSGSAAARAELSRAASAAATEVDALGNIERLSALLERVQAGTYYVPTENLAGAILGEEE